MTCGGGSRSHVRICINGDVGVLGCVGDDVEDEQCNSGVSRLISSLSSPNPVKVEGASSIRMCGNLVSF